MSGEEDLVFSVSNGINVGVNELTGPEIGGVSGMCGIPMRAVVCGLSDPCTAVSGVPPNLVASACSTICTEFCTCVPAESGDGEDRSRGCPFLGPEVGIASERFELSREMSDCVESVPKERAD